MNIGWKGILEIYHPDTNYEHPKAFEIFQLYKEIYENMKKRLELDVDFSINTNQETLGPEKMKFKNKKILEDGEG